MSLATIVLVSARIAVPLAPPLPLALLVAEPMMNWSRVASRLVAPVRSRVPFAPPPVLIILWPR